MIDMFGWAIQQIGNLTGESLDWFGAVFGVLFQLFYDYALWFLEALFFLFHTLFNQFWNFCADRLFTWLLQAAAMYNVNPGNITPVLTLIRTLNWIFPIDMIVTLMPMWCAFECSLLGTRFLLRSWR
jgi:hypothetical protein